jgi:hypothetical protein
MRSLLLGPPGQGGDGGLTVAGTHREPLDQACGLGAFTARADPAQRRQASRAGVGQEVLPHGELGEAALPLSVAGHERDTGADGAGDRAGTVRAAVEKGPTAEEGAGTREGPAQVRVPGAGEADQAQDLPGCEVQVDGSGSGGPCPFQGQDGRPAGRDTGSRVRGRFLADDVVHEAGGAVAGQRAVADEAPVAQYGEGVGDLINLVQAVGDVEDGVSPVAQGVQDAEQPGAVGGGEAGGRLVEHDELRARREGSGDRDQRALGRSQPGDRRVGVEMSRDVTQGVGAAIPGPPPGDQSGAAWISGAQGDVLGDRHPLHETEVLVDEGHVPGGGMTPERVPVHRDPPRVGVVDAGEDLDERGFSGPVGSEKGEDAAGVDVEVDSGERAGPPEPLGEGPDADQGFLPEGRRRLRGRVGSVVHGHLRRSAW